jgi:restriction endonuclease Mrr
MDSKIDNKNNIKIDSSEISVRTSKNPEKKLAESVDENIENLCDENLTTLKKIHAILLNCLNLSKQQKLEFCESERYFMKLYLKKLKNRNEE